MTGLWVGGFQVPPLVVPVVIAYAVLAAVTLWRARRRRARVVPWLLFGGALVFIVVVTLSPPLFLDNPRLYGDHVGRQCALANPEMGWDALIQNHQRLLNVVLFVPLGAFSLAAARTLRRGIAILVPLSTILLPVVIEWVQWAVPSLLRACDSDDLADNWAGLAIGLALAVLVVGLQWAVRREGDRLAS